MRAVVFLCCLTVLVGCPPASDESRKSAPSAACSAVGKSCEVSPGKLGTCVSKEPCTGHDCLVCQSQH